MSLEKNQSGWQKVAKRIRVPLGFAFAALYLWLARPTWTSIAAGAVIAAVGVWIRGFASGYVKKNEELTTTGPYAHTRNPLYLGSVVIGIGFAVAALSWWVVIAIVVLYVAIYVPVIRGEEAFLSARFPQFAQYAASVPRLLPRVTPAQVGAAGERGRFSPELYMKHREYNAIIGAVVVLGALIAKLVWVSR